MINKTKKMTTLALLCALAYIAVFVSRFFPPLFTAFPFLKYDPKDVVIVIAGFLYGPLSSLSVSVAVSLIEMLTVSGTHIIGCLMNIASTCAFSCIAAAVYFRVRSLKGGCIGLVLGTVCCVMTMIVLNYLLTPIYTGMPREAVVKLLVPAILPFNIIKCTLNSALVMLLYKPIVRILRSRGMVEKRSYAGSTVNNMVVMTVALFFIGMCVCAVMIINS
ncbi:MAG: ECF transporter S component [Clostridia bacterium]|nr:ECF transporter S component [Clostridia bacterium]